MYIKYLLLSIDWVMDNRFSLYFKALANSGSFENGSESDIRAEEETLATLRNGRLSTLIYI